MAAPTIPEVYRSAIETIARGRDTTQTLALKIGRRRFGAGAPPTLPPPPPP
jgi:hypothetical protein